ncbi:MAG: Transcriptional regulator [Gemmatimonadetes bacterium]|nr:Transcriptional regulator [Gemmatimonadota bacterium]
MTMEGPDLSSLARTIGEPSRARMLTLLMQGRALTAKELAYGVGIDPATGTAHLRRLHAEGLLTMVAQGRHKYFRLAGAEVAALVESMMVASAAHAAAPMRDEPIRHARFCYDHLAGRLGTGLLNAFVERGILARDDGSFAVTADGEAWFTAFGVDVDALRRGRRRFAAPCLDWSERTDHLAGALGAAIAERMVAAGWIDRVRRSRAVTVTELGRHELSRQLGLSHTSEPRAAAG